MSIIVSIKRKHVRLKVRICPKIQYTVKELHASKVEENLTNIRNQVMSLSIPQAYF